MKIIHVLSLSIIILTGCTTSRKDELNNISPFRNWPTQDVVYKPNDSLVTFTCSHKTQESFQPSAEQLSILNRGHITHAMCPHGYIIGVSSQLMLQAKHAISTPDISPLQLHGSQDISKMTLIDDRK